MSDNLFLTFNDLFDLIESKQIENKNHNIIAELIIQAERDWIIEVENLNDFLIILEKEVGGELNAMNLKRLLESYNQNLSKYSWEAESVSYLMDIFNYTREKDLKKIFNSLSEQIKIYKAATNKNS